MKTLLKQLSTRDISFIIIPSFGISLITAELCFKFGSFTLECLAFLITWFVAGFYLDKICPNRVK
jgi:hypothetical protein